MAVVGNAAGGKSTLCERLARTFSLPWYGIDRVKWRPGWEPVPQPEIDRQCRAWIAEDRWIIDGFGTWEIMAEEFERAEVIVFVDLPLRVHYFRAIRRQIHDLFYIRKDLPPNCRPYRMAPTLMKTIWFTHKLARPRLLKLLAPLRGKRKVVHLQTRSAQNRLLKHPETLVEAATM
ncbi:MAG: hypothetical protein KIS92_00420 [Planctomycetota bacterium]|nr:hypothetical protein [Planctomycetota bacterium]